LQLDVSRVSADRAPSARRLRAWASGALGRRAQNASLVVRVVAPAESRKLNQRWRGKDKPTNVLSFPAPITVLPPGEPRPLGDLVICARVVRDEARAQSKRLAAHWAHLVVHGTLHLIGYDHERGPREQRRMERREIAVLKRFGIANPYVAAEARA
jgi:probable rRNA maturation factor